MTETKTQTTAKMKKCLMFFTLFLATSSFAQTEEYNNTSTTLTFGSGVTIYSLIDFRLSNQKYSGAITPLQFRWSNKFNEKQFRDFTFFIQNGKIANYSITANITEMELIWDYGYKINKDKHFSLFCGPSSFLYLHNRSQLLPSLQLTGITRSIASFATVISLNGNLGKQFIYQMISRFNIIGFGFLNSHDNQSKLLTPFNAAHFYFSPSLTYYPLNCLAIEGQYAFQARSIRAWDKAQSMSDRFILNMVFKF